MSSVNRHVLAAAIRAGASVIVTCNLADVPTHVLGVLRAYMVGGNLQENLLD